MEQSRGLSPGGVRTLLSDIFEYQGLRLGELTQRPKDAGDLTWSVMRILDASRRRADQHLRRLLDTESVADNKHLHPAVGIYLTGLNDGRER